MTWKGPPTMPPPEPDRADYIEVAPPRKTRAQVMAERQAAREAQWPFNVDITCPTCYLVFRLNPDADHRLHIIADRTCDTHIAYVQCPNCERAMRYSIKIEEPRPPSWWQRLWRRRRDG